MTTKPRTYDERVKVWAGDGHLLGSALFQGRAERQETTGVWSWNGLLQDATFDAVVLPRAGELRLEFWDGSVAYALCRDMTPNSQGWDVRVRGNGAPPHAD
jgi:hypothetical protein